MKATDIALASFIGYFGVKYFAKKAAAEKLQFFVQKVNVRFSGITPVLDIILGVQNPTNQTLRIKAIVGELFINGTYTARIDGFQLTTINPLGISYFPISATLSIVGVVTQIKDIVQAIIDGGFSAVVDKVLRFKGNVYAEGVSVPLDFSYKVL